MPVLRVVSGGSVIRDLPVIAETWSGNTPYTTGQLSLCATMTELASCSSRNLGSSNKGPTKPNIKINNKIKIIYIYIYKMPVLIYSFTGVDVS